MRRETRPEHMSGLQHQGLWLPSSKLRSTVWAPEAPSSRKQPDTPPPHTTQGGGRGRGGRVVQC